MDPHFRALAASDAPDSNFREADDIPWSNAVGSCFFADDTLAPNPNIIEIPATLVRNIASTRSNHKNY